jgi:hypothetical protein
MEVNGNEVGTWDGIIKIILEQGEEIKCKKIVLVAQGTEDDKYITLNDCLDIIGYKDGICTVIIDDCLSGRIYQYGNYRDGKWYEYGKTKGYA